MLGAGNSNREVVEPRQRQRIDDKRGVERYLRLEAGLGILREELNAGGAGIEREDRIGFGSARLGELDGEVELIGPLGIFLADDAALEVRLEAGDHVLAGSVVGRDQERRLDAFLVEVFADRLWNLIALPRHREEP